jgi:hypothetical protein
MNEIVHLEMIIEKLSAKELIHIRENLYTSSNKQTQNQVAYKLFNLLTNNKNLSIDKVSIEIYNKINKVALKKLTQRLIEKILDILITKEILINSGLFDDRGIEIFNIRRKLLYYDVLASHGITEYAMVILEQVIRTSKKIEAYDYLIISLEKKLKKISIRFGLNSYNKLFEEIKYYTDCNWSLKESIYIFRMYSSNYDYKKLISKNDLSQSIKKIHTSWLRTKSKNIKINLIYLQSIFYFDNGDYLKCRRLFSELYSFLKSNPKVVFKTHFIDCILNMAEIETMLWNFDFSLKYLRRVANYYERNEFNNKLIKEMFFLNEFYNGNLKNAKTLIENIITKNTSKMLPSFINSKRIFYFASILTIEKSFKESNSLIIYCAQLDKDKEGWNLGVRLLTIINNIELEKFLLVENQIENFRKHLARSNDNSIYYARMILISKLLIALSNGNFDFVKVNYNNKKIIENLNDIEAKFKWQLKSPEMIIFHEWFDAKVKNIPYDHAEIMKRLKKKNKVLA